MSSADPLLPSILQLFSESSDYTLYGTSWIPSSARLVSVGMNTKGQGPVTIWSFKDKRLVKESEHIKSEALKCVTFGASIDPKRHFATGDHKGHLFVYDIENIGTPLYSSRGHSQMINCVDGVGGKDPMKYGAPEIATGSSDGKVQVWDIRRAAPVLTFSPSEESVLRVGRPDDGYVEVTPECWCVAFGNSFSQYERWLAMGYDNGDLKIIDMRTMKVFYSQHFQNGIVSIDFDRPDIKGNKLTIGTLQGHVYIIDLKTLHSEQGFACMDFKPFGTENTVTIWSTRHCPSNRDIFLCSGSGRLALCNYEYPPERSRKLEDGSEVGVLGKCKVVCDVPMNSQAVNTISWNRDKPGLIGWSAMDQTINIGFVTNLNKLD